MSAQRSNHVLKAVVAFFILGVFIASSGLCFPVRADTGIENPQKLLAVANDDFDNALVVSGLPYSNSQDIISATVASDDPSFPCLSGQRYNTVWYSFTPAVSDSLVFSTAGSQYTSILGVWTGTRGSLINQACSTTTQAILTVNAGTTYFIEVARSSDIIIPTPTSVNIVFAIWPASTMPDAFNKTSPANGNTSQSIRPTIKWSASTYAASYAYCYDTTDNDTCDTSWVATTATSVSLTGLGLGTPYYWHVRAVNVAGDTYADANTWWSFTTAAAADLNHWTGLVSGSSRTTAFDVLTGGQELLNISVQVPYNGCNKTGTSTILVGGPSDITNRHFSYNGGNFIYSGTFSTSTTATGTYQLINYPICVWTQPGYCCYAFTSGSGTWAAGGPPLTPEYPVFLPLIMRN